MKKPTAKTAKKDMSKPNPLGAKTKSYIAMAPTTTIPCPSC